MIDRATIDRVTEILSKCDTDQTNISPTLLYNEGWMTRLLVSASIKYNIRLHGIDFGSMRRWYSEGLLSSPFLARKRGDKFAEGYTHTDMALGDFKLDSPNRGQISVEGSDGVFGVIEAKMGSPLSPGTKNAPHYNQASRNLACIAFNTRTTKHELFLAVAAPAVKIKEHGIEAQVELQTMLDQISDRFKMYDRDSDVYALKDVVLQRAHKCRCMVISFESWIDALSSHDVHSGLTDFQQQCYKFNRVGP